MLCRRFWQPTKQRLRQYFSEKKELELYRGLVDEILRTKEHVLSAEMEKLVAMTGRDGTDARSRYIPSSTMRI